MNYAAGSIVVDTDSVWTGGKDVREISDDLRQAIDDLQTVLEPLRESWRSQAGVKLFEEYGDSFRGDVYEYATLLEHISSELFSAVDTYGSITL